MDNGFQDLKAQFGGKVSSVQMRDANARRQEASRETSFIYTRRLVFTEKGKRVEIFASGELACISIPGEFDVPLVTVNCQDRGGFTSFSIGRVRIGSFDCEVFTKDGAATDSQNRLLRSVELADLISIHSFKKGEALHLYRNCLVLYVRPEDLSSALVLRMVAIAEVIPKHNGATAPELPAQFADLADILMDWGIADDLKRSDKIGGASEQELRQLLTAVEPRLAAISSYLNGREENSASDATDNLGAIMEATFEARAALVRRSAKNN